MANRWRPRIVYNSARAKQLCAVLCILGVVVLSGLSVPGYFDPASKPPNVSNVSGSLSDGAVQLENVDICGCWNGLHNQVENLQP
jgi:hypothetical protein